MKRTKGFIGSATLISCVLLALAACGGDSDSQTTEDGTTQIEAKDANRTLVLYNYEEYIGENTVEQFEKATGIDVVEIFYGDEEEALASLQSESEKYDLMVISGDTVREMIQAKTLAPLDHELIPNLENIAAEFSTNYYDNGLLYSVPYMWGTTGIVVNRNFVADEESWQILWNEDYAGKIGMLYNPFEILAVGLLKAGHSINADEPDQMNEARDLIINQKPLVHGYYDDMEAQELMVSEEIWAAQIYNGEGMLLMDTDDKFEFFVPVEGAARWVDCFIIPRDAPNMAAAHEFLNYILDPEINAGIASELWYATPNEKAIPLMDEEVRESPMVFPPPEVLARCEYFDAFGEPTSFASRLWADLVLGD